MKKLLIFIIFYLIIPAFHVSAGELRENEVINIALL